MGFQRPFHQTTDHRIQATTCNSIQQRKGSILSLCLQKTQTATDLPKTLSSRCASWSIPLWPKRRIKIPSCTATFCNTLRIRQQEFHLLRCCSIDSWSLNYPICSRERMTKNWKNLKSSLLVIVSWSNKKTTYTPTLMRHSSSALRRKISRTYYQLFFEHKNAKVLSILISRGFV